MEKTIRRLLFIIVLVLTFAACKKIVRAIFPSMDETVPDIQVTLPAVPFVPPQEMSLGSYTAHFNLDSNIRASTNGSFDISYVSSIKIKV